MSLGQECHRSSDIVPMAGYRFRGYEMSVGFIPSDINPDHLVKVVPAGLFHSKVTIVLFVVNK